jgi:PhnB protein
VPLGFQFPAMTYKPDGYTDLAPYLIVRDAEAVLTFCENVFGAARLRVIANDSGGIMHAECRIGDTVLMMGEADGPAAMLHLYLEDPDAAFDRALANGAEVLQPMMEKGDGDRRGGVRSPDGTQWYVSRQVNHG